MSNRVNPLPIVLPKHEHSWSKYPDIVRVSMEDGKVINYRIEVQQPAPVFREQLDRFSEMIGYRRSGK